MRVAADIGQQSWQQQQAARTATRRAYAVTACVLLLAIISMEVSKGGTVVTGNPLRL